MAKAISKMKMPPLLCNFTSYWMKQFLFFVYSGRHDSFYLIPKNSHTEINRENLFHANTWDFVLSFNSYK